MGLTINMNLQQWESYMHQLPARFMPAALRGVLSGALRCVPLMQTRTNEAPPASDRGSVGAVDTGRYRAAWAAEQAPSGARLFNKVPWAGVIEYGRRPAPVGGYGIKNLQMWVENKLKLSGNAAKSAAWAIAKSLETRRLRERRVMTGAEKEMVGTVEAEIVHELDLEIQRR